MNVTLIEKSFVEIGIALIILHKEAPNKRNTFYAFK